jgi:hypothetical protein
VTRAAGLPFFGDDVVEDQIFLATSNDTRYLIVIAFEVLAKFI